MSSLSPANILSLPPATRSLLGALALISTFLFLLKLSSIDPTLRSHPSVWSSSSDSLGYPWVVVVPGKVMWYPWTLLLSGFAETSFVEVSLAPKFCIRSSSAVVNLKLHASRGRECGGG
jgi:hypothetical protein